MGAGDVARAAGLGEVFTRAQGLAAGLTPAQLRGPAVRRVFRGVFTLGDPSDLGMRARAALALAGQGALVCESTALALLGVELPDAAPADAVHIWVGDGPRLAMAGIRVHRDTWSGVPAPVAPGIEALDLATCWLQCAGALPVEDLVVLADGLTRRSDPILGLDDLRQVLEHATGRRGVRAARAALGLAREGTGSSLETRVRLALVAAGLPCPAVFHPLRSPRGDVPYHLQMAYPEARVGVECEAPHPGDEEQMRADLVRRRWIEDRGWRIITGSFLDLPDPSGLVASVRHALGG